MFLYKLLYKLIYYKVYEGTQLYENNNNTMVFKMYYICILKSITDFENTFFFIIY